MKVNFEKNAAWCFKKCSLVFQIEHPVSFIPGFMPINPTGDIGRVDNEESAFKSQLRLVSKWSK